MNKYITKYPVFAASALLLSAVAALGGADNNPVSNGMTQARNASGFTFDGAFGNPALVGLDRPPRTSLSFFPTSFALWSDKLAPPFNSYLLMDLNNLNHAIALYATSLIEESFPDLKSKISGGITLDEAKEISDILTKELDGGVGIYGGFRTSPIVFSTRGFALNVRTYADADVRIPTGLLLPFFSDDAGLRAGQTLDFSELNVDAVWASEIGVKLGFSIDAPFIRDYLKLDKGAAGVGIKLVLGHMLFQIKTDQSSKNNLYYNEETNKYEMDAKFNITNVGTGFSGDWNYDNPFWSKTISGQGWGLDLGTVFHNDNHFLSLDVQNFGMIFWGANVHETTLTFKKDGFDLVGLTDNFDAAFNRQGGDGYWPNAEDTLKPAGRLTTWLPAALNVGYTYVYDFSKYESVKPFTNYASGSVSYEQQLVPGPGRNTYMPRFTLGAATGLLAGYLPLRYGIIMGGSEGGGSAFGLSSAFGFGFDFHYTALDVSYKAIGSPFLISEKGFEAAAALTFKWGWKKKEKRFKDREPAPPPPEPEPEYVPEEPPVPEVEPPQPEPEPVIEIIVAPPEPEIVPESEPEPLPTVEEVQMLETSQKAINFKIGSAELTESSFGALKNIADLLKNYPHVRYEIQGHTDSDGSRRLNLMLSSARAASVRNYLIDQGAPGASLVGIGYGPEKPIASNATVEGRALNRRVEFVLIESQEQYEALQKREAELDLEIKRAGVRGAQRRR